MAMGLTRSYFINGNLNLVIKTGIIIIALAKLLLDHVLPSYFVGYYFYVFVNNVYLKSQKYYDYKWSF